MTERNKKTLLAMKKKEKRDNLLGAIIFITSGLAIAGIVCAKEVKSHLFS